MTDLPTTPLADGRTAVPDELLAAGSTDPYLLRLQAKRHPPNASPERWPPATGPFRTTQVNASRTAMLDMHDEPPAVGSIHTTRSARKPSAIRRTCASDDGRPPPGRSAPPRSTATAPPCPTCTTNCQRLAAPTPAPPTGQALRSERRPADD